MILRVEEYINSGRDGCIVDPDRDKIYTKRKERRNQAQNQEPDEPDSHSSVDSGYPKDGWTSDLKRMPFFTRAEMNTHISRSGKNIDPNTTTHTVPTCIRKATTFLNDEYLKEILASSNEKFFYFKALCHHSYKKNDPPHHLKIKLCLLSGEVIHANCTCVAGKVGFCNHILALMLKICKFSLYESTSVNELDTEDDMNPKQACTSQLQQWHRKGREDCISPKAVMDCMVFKTSLQDTSKSRKEPGVKCLLYEARTNPKSSQENEKKLKEQLQKINPKMALAQILNPSCTLNTQYVATKFGKSPEGSFSSYQLSFTEDNFKVFLDINSVPRQDSNFSTPLLAFPRFPINEPTGDFEIPPGLNEQENDLLKSLQVDSDQVAEIERKTQAQGDCEEWRKERQFRFTASNFSQICCRKRQHETLVNNLLHPKSFTSRYTEHGKRYESVALREYQKYMHTIKKPVVVYKSGLVVSVEEPYLGASPDGKVIDKGCTQHFGLIEIKCPQTKFMVTPLEACSDGNFFLEDLNGKPKLKHNHMYFKQVQGQLGVTGTMWCDFVAYTCKGMSIERIPFNQQFWSNMKTTLKSYYFQHFLSTAATEFHRLK